MRSVPFTSAYVAAAARFDSINKLAVAADTVAPLDAAFTAAAVVPAGSRAKAAPDAVAEVLRVVEKVA